MPVSEAEPSTVSLAADSAAGRCCPLSTWASGNRPAILALVVAAAAATLPGWLPGRVLAPLEDSPWADPTSRAQPAWTMEAARAWRGGHLPLWNARRQLGEPLAGNGWSAVFYPTVFIHAVLPAGWAFTLSAAAKLLAAGAGMWMLARRHGLECHGRLIAALAFMLCAYNTKWLGHPRSNVIVLLPWVLLAVDCVIQRASALRILLLALAAGVAMLGGWGEAARGTLLAATALWLGSVLMAFAAVRNGEGPSLGRVLRALPAMALALATGALAAGIQWVPLLDYRSNWPAEAFDGGSAPVTAASRLLNLAGAVFPYVSRDGASAGGWIGAIGILLAVAGIAGLRRDRRARLWTCLAGATGLVGVLCGGTESPAVMAACALSLAMLAGIGAQRLSQRLTGDEPTRAARRMVLVAGVAAALLAAAGIATIAVSGTALAVFPAATVGALAVVLWLCGLRARPSAPAVQLAAAALLAVDLIAFGLRFNRASPRSAFRAETPAALYIAEQHGKSPNAPFRVLALGSPAQTGQPAAMGFSDPRGGTRGMSKGVRDWLSANAPGLLDRSRPLDLNDAAMRLLAVRYVVAPAGTPSPGPAWRAAVGPTTRPSDAHGERGFVVYENTRWLPRAWLARSPDDPPALMRKADYDPRSAAMVRGTASIEWLEDSPARIRLRVRGSDGWLVLSDAHAPGWNATLRQRVFDRRSASGKPRIVDREVAIRPAYGGALRAVSVPSGEHEVIFEYAPRGWHHAIMASLAGVVMLLILGGWGLLGGEGRPGGVAPAAQEQAQRPEEQSSHGRTDMAQR